MLLGKDWVKPITPLPDKNIHCPNCGKDMGIGNVFHMVLPPQGLVCSCGHTVIHTNSVLFY
jgi:hypothetical protein